MEAQIETKHWSSSKTIIVGILEIVSGLALWASGSVETGAPLTLAGAVQIVLRIVTKTPVTK